MLAILKLVKKISLLADFNHKLSISKQSEDKKVVALRTVKGASVYKLCVAFVVIQEI